MSLWDDANPMWRKGAGTSEPTKPSLNAPEPPPTDGEGPPVWELVRAEMLERHEAGVAKYGRPLRAFDGRKSLVDAYQEALDLAVYLRKEIEERKIAADSPLREQLAALAHEQWSGWMEHVFRKTEHPFGTPLHVIPKWAEENWQRQMRTPYAELSEKEKDSDRREADRVLALVEVVAPLSSEPADAKCDNCGGAHDVTRCPPSPADEDDVNRRWAAEMKEQQRIVREKVSALQAENERLKAERGSRNAEFFEDGRIAGARQQRAEFAEKALAEEQAQRAMWEERDTARAESAALRQALGELLGHGHNLKAWAGNMLRWNEPGVDFSDEARRIVKHAEDSHALIVAALSSTAGAGWTPPEQVQALVACLERFREKVEGRQAFNVYEAVADIDAALRDLGDTAQPAPEEKATCADCGGMDTREGRFGAWFCNVCQPEPIALCPQCGAEPKPAGAK